MQHTFLWCSTILRISTEIPVRLTKIWTWHDLSQQTNSVISHGSLVGHKIVLNHNLNKANKVGFMLKHLYKRTHLCEYTPSATSVYEVTSKAKAEDWHTNGQLTDEKQFATSHLIQRWENTQCSSVCSMHNTYLKYWDCFQEFEGHSIQDAHNTISSTPVTTNTS